ncbi:multi-sensor signal transduction histidine kinase [Halovivax asiaticus JCM 14624]|uniref:histidine kinase n=1 Tax=Halovivax asiaticus JCM 14624 TaxID=1227490 RepID=M0BMV9_9EURY|nr:histidine kinase N-terminal 7TM domain-containing protein [Halovivax asiaticus]ELZ12231.1 multi-sensor signal transduction histidine kinase [Halovivax asiaticus JCM 14624]
MTPLFHRVWFVLLVAGVVVTLSVAILALRNRETDGATALAVTASSITIWLLGDLGATLATTVSASTRWVQFLWIGAALTPTAMFVFVVRYTGRTRFLTDWVRAGLVVATGLVIAVVFTHGSHTLLWREVYAAPATPIGIAFDHGPAFYAYTVYAYSLTAAATFFVARFYHRSKTIYRGQAAALGVGILAPWIASTVFVFGGTTFDPSSLAFTVTAAAFAVAILRYRFVDVMPVARETIVDAIEDGVLVLDRQGRIVDANPQAIALLGVDSSIIGRDAGDELPDSITNRNRSDSHDQVTIRDDEHSRYLAIDETEITDRQARPIGRLLIVRDVTEQRRYERELERQNERLDRFASVVSHDLRNPLNVADGYRSILAERYDDTELDEIQTALDRMEHIIEDVLTLARHGDVVADPTLVDLGTLATTAWNGVDTADATLRIETGDHRLTADDSRLTQALENLFRNAVEHGSTSPPSSTRQDAVEHGGPDVTVTVGTIDVDDVPNSASEQAVAPETGERAGFYVADDGVGIPEDAREDVLESGYSTNADGTGLGLDIVTQIVEAHGWSLAVTESADGGARIEIDYELDHDPAKAGATERHSQTT